MHLIRLRGPWELRPATAPDAATSRIVLPAEALPPSDLPLTLLRRFGRPAPRLGPSACRLRIEDAPGLIRASLNGSILPLPVAGAAPPGPIDLPIPAPLGPRNLLELTVAPGPSRSGPDGRPWGSIALAFAAEADAPG